MKIFVTRLTFIRLVHSMIGIENQNPICVFTEINEK